MVGSYHDGSEPYDSAERRGLHTLRKLCIAARNFGRYTLQAQREAVPVSRNGTLAGYFVSPHEYEERRRLKIMRRSFNIAELSDEEFEEIEAAARMDPRHEHLNKILDPKMMGSHATA
jgi:hypothetical protein